MEQKISKVFLLIIALSGIIISCNPDVGGKPVLEFLTGSKYTYKNDSVAPGDSLLFGIKCKWNGADALKKITVLKNDALIETIEINPIDGEGVAFGVKYKKSAENDSLVFELLDAASNMATLNLVLYPDTSLSDLRGISGIVLGAQDNKTDSALYSISRQKSHSIAYANSNEATQKVIDFVAAYDTQNQFHIGSPATNFNNIYDFSAWKQKDTTEFIQQTFTNEEYGTLNQTKIKAIFDDTKETEVLTKTNGLSTEDTYLFHTQAGKYGVLKINSVTKGVDGSVNFDLKIQR